MQLLNIRFSFLCRSTHSNDQGKQPIILRVSFRGERRDLFTGLYCGIDDWDNQSGTVLKTDKAFKSINENLKIILQKANLAFDELKFSGESFTIHELVAKMEGYESRPKLLIDFLEESLKRVEERRGANISKGTFFKYRRSLEHVKDFLQAQYKVKNIALQRINVEFLDQYFVYLRKEKNISNNTALKYFKFFKSFLFPAIKSGLIKDDPFLQVRHKSTMVFIEVLSQEEIDKIDTLELTSKDLERVRDIFLFACYTGLAYIDIKYLRSEHIVLDTNHTLHI